MRILSYAASVYVPSFMIIYMRRAACDGPYISLFQRDLLLSFEEFDKPLSEVVMKYFLKRASPAFWKKFSLYSNNPFCYRRSKNFYFVAIPTKRQHNNSSA